jgi:hypothetical protein
VADYAVAGRYTPQRIVGEPPGECDPFGQLRKDRRRVDPRPRAIANRCKPLGHRKKSPNRSSRVHNSTSGESGASVGNPPQRWKSARRNIAPASGPMGLPPLRITVLTARGAVQPGWPGPSRVGATATVRALDRHPVDAVPADQSRDIRPRDHHACTCARRCRSNGTSHDYRGHACTRARRCRSNGTSHDYRGYAATRRQPGHAPAAGQRGNAGPRKA